MDNVAFDGAFEGSAALSLQDEGNDRNALRCFSELDVTLKTSAGIYFAGVIQNISESGCMVAIFDDEHIDVGCIVALNLTGYPVISGRVVWSQKSKAGIRFILPIAPNLVEDLVKLSLLTRLEQFKPSVDPTEQLPPLTNWTGRFGD